MSLLDTQNREIYYKVVYCGPGLSGKTQNLQYLFEKTSPEAKGKLLSLSANHKQTMRFDFLPLSFGEIHGLQVWFHLYAIPGQVFYEPDAFSLLKGTDGLIFVADSKPERFEANVESFETIQEHLTTAENPTMNIPFVIQYNKRDLQTALPLTKLQTFCSSAHTPSIEAIALQGMGVFETLKELAKQVFRQKRRSS